MNFIKSDNMNSISKNLTGEMLSAINQYKTPLYFYDTDTIRLQIKKFREAFKTFPLLIHYAMKANSNLQILKLMLKEGVSLDTVSLPEILTGLKVGFKSKQIVFTPNMVDFEEITEAVRFGVFINIENLSNLEKFGKKYGKSVPCCIRLNPQIISEMEGEKVRSWHEQSKFGISLNNFDRLKSIISKYSLRIEGLHIHSSHVIMNPEVFEKGVATIFQLAAGFPHLNYIDLGGGLNFPKPGKENILDIGTLSKGIQPYYNDLCRKSGKAIELWFEPGRFLVAESGILLVQVKVLKSNGEVNFVGVDSGFNHLIRPMLYQSYHPIINLSNPGGSVKTYNIVGNLCEIDNFAVKRELNEVREGDFLAILNAGAYGFSMSSRYNSRFRPAEVWLKDHRVECIRKRETLEDLFRNQVE